MDRRTLTSLNRSAGLDEAHSTFRTRVEGGATPLAQSAFLTNRSSVVTGSVQMHRAWRTSLTILAVGVGWFGWSSYHLVVDGLKESDPELMGDGAALGLIFGSLGLILFVVVAVMTVLVLFAAAVDLLAPWSEGGAAIAGIVVSLTCLVPFGLLALFGNFVATMIVANLVAMSILGVATLTARSRPIVANPPPPKPADWQPASPEAPSTAITDPNF